MQKQHDAPNLFLLRPTRPDFFAAGLADSANVQEEIRRIVDDVERCFVIDCDNACRQARANAANRAGCEIVFDPRGRRWMRRFQPIRFELATVVAIDNPAPTRFDRLPGRDDADIADHGQRIDVATHTDLENGEPAVGVVINDAFDRSRKRFQHVHLVDAAMV